MLLFFRRFSGLARRPVGNISTYSQTVRSSPQNSRNHGFEPHEPLLSIVVGFAGGDVTLDHTDHRSRLAGRRRSVSKTKLSARTEAALLPQPPRSPPPPIADRRHRPAPTAARPCSPTSEAASFPPPLLGRGARRIVPTMMSKNCGIVRFLCTDAGSAWGVHDEILCVSDLFSV